MPYGGKKRSQLKGQALDARNRELASNPATRHLVDTAMLRRLGYGKQAKAREMNTRLDQPITAGSNVSERDLAHQAAAATSIRYGDAQRLAARQEQMAPEYYKHFLNILGASQAQSQVRAQQTADAIRAEGASGPQAPGSQNANVANYQAATALNMGQAQQGYLGAIQAQGAAAGAQARAKAAQSRQDLAREAGQFNLEYRGKFRQDEANTVATAALTGQKQETSDAQFAADLGLTPAQLLAMSPAERLNAIKRGTKAKTKPATPKSPKTPSTIASPPSNYTGSEADWNNLNRAQRDAWVKAHPTSRGPKGDKPVGPYVTPAQEAKYVGTVERVYGWLRNPPNWPAGPKRGKRMTPAEVVESLQHAGVLSPKGPVDPRVLDIARSRFHNDGKVGDWGRKRAKDLGIHVGRWGVVGG